MPHDATDRESYRRWDGRGDAERTGRAVLLRMPPRKWRLVRAAESGIRLVLPLLPQPRALDTIPKQPQCILVVEYWNLGDLAVLVPFLRNLRESYPEARIVLLANPGLASFLKDQGIVDEIIPVRVPWAQHFSRWKKYNPFSGHWVSFIKTLWGLRRREFDWAISGRMDVRDNFLLWLTGAARRIGYGFGGGGFLLTDCVIPDLSRPHRTEVWLQLLRALGNETAPGTSQFHHSPESLIKAQSLLAHLHIPNRATVVGVHPGARMAVRRWGDDNFAEVTTELLTNEDVHVLWFLEPNVSGGAPKVDRCHEVRLDFDLFLAALSMCQFLVCNDSGPMHLAGLLGVPVVAVFGPQKPEWFGPRGAHDRVVIRQEIWCRPCFDYCIFDQPYCLRAITPEQTILSVKEVLHAVRPGSVGTETGRSDVAVASGEKLR